jgi:mitogen-activated protein kinase kinase
MEEHTEEDFERVKRVGKGGQAIVEIWKLKGTDRLFAAKIYEEPVAEDSDRLAREVEMLTGLDHPSLVKGFGMILPKKAGDRAVILMENCSGGSLSVIGRALDATKQIEAIISICKGLLYLHSKKVIHGDLKPSNILLSSDGVVKIADFGSARLMEMGMTQTGRGGNTTLYAAPELHEEEGEASEASDVWALGLTLYEVVAKKPAFDAKWKLAKLLRTIGSDERPELPASVSAELREVITSCWDKDPRKRMTAQEICEKLSKVGWLVVEGGDAGRIRAFLERFPLDQAATGSDIAAALADRERVIVELESEVATLKRRVAALEAGASSSAREIASKAQQLEAQAREVARQKATIASLAQEVAKLKETIASQARENAALVSTPKQAPATRSLLDEGRDALVDLGVRLAGARLLIGGGRRWEMSTFNALFKAKVSSAAPTRLLVEEREHGYVVGGYVAAQWRDQACEDGGRRVSSSR